MAAYTTIDNPELYFQVKTYTGTGSSQAITLDGDKDMQPSMIWIKNRADSTDHRIFDAVREASKSLIPNNTDAEYDDNTTVMLSSFNSDGFTVVSHSNVNDSSDSHVAWCWKETADAGFDIVSYAGNGVEGRNISHSLSAVPHVMIVKNRTNAVKWAVYHHKNTAAPETDHLVLDTTAATSDDDSTWDDTAPGSSVFRVKGSTSVNGNSANYVAYLFSEKQGFSKFGSYTGNGNADGAFVYTGMKISWLMVKKTNSASNNEWIIWDNKRSTFNMVEKKLAANLTNAETDASWVGVDFLSNGFKFRSNDSIFNGSGDTYVYMAFAEAPFVNSNGVPCNAR